MTSMATNKRIGVSIVHNELVTSDFSKFIFNPEEICIKGGFICRKTQTIPLPMIDRVYYSSLLPKIRMELKNGSYTATMQTSWWSKRKVLAFFKEQGILCCKRKNYQTNLFKRVGMWYDFWYFTPPKQ